MIKCFLVLLSHRFIASHGYSLQRSDGLGLRRSVLARSTVRMSTVEEKKVPKVVVIGSGWAGLGAAKALSENGASVVLVEAGNPSEPCLTPSGKPFEPGTRGFWLDYPNINALGDELKVGDIYTDFTESSFFGPEGLECTAPVFSGSQELPSPLGQVYASFDRFKRLPLLDRVSILGLFGAMADLNRNPEVFAAYDRMTAHELFLRVGVTKRLVDDFLKPTLLVGLFKPPEELSAAVTMELLYYYALAHQSSFDVRWIAKGTVQSALLDPLTNALRDKGVEFLFDTYATKLHYNENKNAVTKIDLKSKNGLVSTIDNVDGVVLALGAKGLRSVIFNSPQLAKKCPELAQTAGLDGIDVVACRLWLDRKIATDTPVGVFSKFDALRGAGGTFFMLDQLQKDNLDQLWGDDNNNDNTDTTIPADQRGSVLACDFYNGAAIAALDDDEIIRILKEELLPNAYPAFRQATVLDSHVKRYPKAVSWFAPGSFTKRPPLKTTLKNVVCAGDLVRMGDREHGAKGLCQERALVSGFEAANELASNGALPRANNKKYPVLQVRDDEPQYLAAVQINKFLQNTFLDPLGLGSFWVR